MVHLNIRRPFDKTTALILRKDVIAGLTLASIGIPEVMGYTKIIGMPVKTGLYTMILPALVFAGIGSSRRLVVGADSATAAIVASGLAAIALQSGQQHIEMACLVAFTTGLLLLLARILRLGFLSNFLSQTVLVGFLSGVGVQVMLGQIPGMLRIERPHDFSVGGLSAFALNFSHVHLPSLILSVTIAVLVFVLEKCAKRFPAPLLLLAIVTFLSSHYDFAHLGMVMIGEIQGGFPSLGLPVASAVPLPILFSISCSCCIVILAQSAATSSVYALKHHEELDQNRDLLGLGAANIAAALSGAFVVNGSPTRTSVVDGAGCQTQRAHIVAALAASLVVLFLTRPLAAMPDAALAAIVFVIGVRLIDYRGLRDIYHQSPVEFVLAVLTMFIVVLIGVEQGIILALALSLLYHVRRSYKPKTDLLVQDKTGRWVRFSSEPGLKQIVGVRVYWFGADLFYANVSHFAKELHSIANTSGSVSPGPAVSGEKQLERPRLVVVDAGAITGIDYTAAGRVKILRDELNRSSVRLVWAHVSEGLRQDMIRHRIYEPESLFSTLRECLNHFGFLTAPSSQ